MEKEKMKEVILGIYAGKVSMEDALNLVCEFMVKTQGSVNQKILQHISNQHDPIAMQMLQRAVEVSKQHFESTEVTITRVFKKDGTFIYAF